MTNKTRVNKGVPKVKPSRTTYKQRMIKMEPTNVGNKNYTNVLIGVFIAIISVVLYIVLK